MSKIDVINPYTSELLEELPLASEREVLHLIDKAKAAEGSMRNLSSYQKQQVLRSIASGIAERAEAFILTICKESGKPYKYAKGEVERAQETFLIAAELCSQSPHELFDLDRTEKGKGIRGSYVYFPVGLVVGISPFNFPLNLAVHKIAPAIATGCPIIIKPSSKTPLTMRLLEEVIQSSGLPEGGFTVVNCAREQGNLLIESEAVNLISFTGSPEVGWALKAKSGKKKVVLELGGNAAVIVCEDANVQMAVEHLVVGGFAYSGQVCIHTQRIYVHQSLFTAFCKKYVDSIKQWKNGNPTEKDTDFSVMIDEANAIRIENWVKEATQAGAKVLLGGERAGAFYPPTVLTNVPKGQKVLEEEVFGPVVVIAPYNTLEEAIDLVNDSRWGLQASIYTDKISYLDKAFNDLHVGGVMHNLPTTFRVDEMPYGGIKDSGFGREGVKYAMMDYLEGKLLVKNVRTAV